MHSSIPLLLNIYRFIRYLFQSSMPESFPAINETLSKRKHDTLSRVILIVIDPKCFSSTDESNEVRVNCSLCDWLVPFHRCRPVYNRYLRWIWPIFFIERKVEIVVPAMTKEIFDPWGEESTFHFITDHSIISPSEIMIVELKDQLGRAVLEDLTFGCVEQVDRVGST